MRNKKEKANDVLDKYEAFFNYAKRYHWLIDEERIGNLERAIINDYYVLFSETTKKIPLSEFNMVWNRLNEIRLEVFRKKKNDMRNGIKIKNVLDFPKN